MFACEASEICGAAFIPTCCSPTWNQWRFCLPALASASVREVLLKLCLMHFLPFCHLVLKRLHMQCTVGRFQICVSLVQKKNNNKKQEKNILSRQNYSWAVVIPACHFPSWGSVQHHYEHYEWTGNTGNYHFVCLLLICMKMFLVFTLWMWWFLSCSPCRRNRNQPCADSRWVVSLFWSPCL